MERITHQYLFICVKCKVVFYDVCNRAFCPNCDNEMPCLGYVPQCKINEVREAIRRWWDCLSN